MFKRPFITVPHSIDITYDKTVVSSIISSNHFGVDSCLLKFVNFEFRLEFHQAKLTLPLKYAWLMVLNAWCSNNRLVLIFTAWCSILYAWLNGFIRLLQQKRFNHLVDGLNRLVDGLAAC